MADPTAFAEFATGRHAALFRYAYLLAGDRGLAVPPTYLSMFFGQWLDGSTCTIAAELESGDLDLLVVDARTGTAEVAVPKFTKLTFSKTPAYTATVALPTGRPIVDLA